MLIAEFSHKGEEIEIDNVLWQHDYGQKIQIKGLDLPEVFEVHFAWKDLEKAKVVTGSTVDGVSTVDIPNIALEQRRAKKKLRKRPQKQKWMICSLSGGNFSISLKSTVK